MLRCRNGWGIARSRAPRATHGTGMVRMLFECCRMLFDAVWWVLRRCLVAVWLLFGGCRVAARRLSGGCLMVV
eukprot:7780053-Lingulodinium_polyedra.AAC.1